MSSRTYTMPSPTLLPPVTFTGAEHNKDVLQGVRAARDDSDNDDMKVKVMLMKMLVLVVMMVLLLMLMNMIKMLCYRRQRWDIIKNRILVLC